MRACHSLQFELVQIGQFKLIYYSYFKERLCITQYLKIHHCDHPCKMCDHYAPKENHHCDIAKEYSKIRWMDALVMHSERNKGADGSAVLFSHLH